MTYKEVINDEKIKKYYEIIDENNNYYMSHGLKHINNVIDYCKKFSLLFNLNKEDENLLLIAASLHDIGAHDGRSNHAYKSGVIAKEFLKDKLSDKEVDIIVKIIERHGKESVRETLLEKLLFLADKFDFTKERLEDNYIEKYNFTSLIDKLIDIQFVVEDDGLVIKFITNNLTFEEFLNEKPYYEKGIELNAMLLGNLQNKKYKVMFDDKVIFHD